MKDSFIHIFSNGSVALNNPKPFGKRIAIAVLLLLWFSIPFFVQAQHLDNRKRLDSLHRARAATALSTLATVYNVTGGGAYCSGGSGVAVGLDDSETDTTYQLRINGINTGEPVMGTGGAISFGLQTAAGTYTVVAVTETGAVTMAGSVMVVINPTPTVSSVTDQIYCSGASAPSTTLSGPVSGTTFNWTNSNTAIELAASGSGNIPSFTAGNNTTAPITAIITITPTANGCTGTPITYNITVNPTPTVSSVANQTYCSGTSASSTTISGPVSGTTFSWTNNNTSIGLAASGNGNIPSFTATNASSAPVTATITITPSADGCTGTPITYNITVNPTPTVSSVTDQTYCSGANAPSITLSGPVSGTTFTWTNSNPSIGLTASGSGNIPSFTATNASSAPVTATITITPSANGCTGTPITYNITVNPTPTVSSVTDQTYCSGASAPSTTLSGPVSGTTFTWTNSNPAIGLAASGPGNIPSFTAANASSAPVTATITITPSANGCTGTPIAYNITVNPTPTVSSVTDQTYCSGASAPSTTLSGPVSGTTFTWTNSNPAIGLAASGSGNIPSFTAGNNTTAPITATITITPTANGCTGTPITYNITVNPTPTVLSVTDQTYCSGASAPSTTLSGPVSGTTFTWTNSNTSIGLAASGSGNIPSFTATNASSAPVTATITVTPSANGCIGTPITYNITVNPTPTVSTVTDQTYCSGASAPSTTLSGPVSSTSFTWTNSNPTIELTASGSGNIPSFTAGNNTTVPITATITITPTANGCTGTPITYNITVNPTPTVSSVTDLTYCSGASAPSITLSGPVSGTTFSWTNSNPAIGLAASGSGNIPSFTATNATTTPAIATITITPSANGCTGTPITYNITVNPTPTVSSVTDLTYCSGASAPSITLSGPVSGTSFTWTNNNPAIGLAASGSGNVPSFTAGNNTTAPITATITVTPTANGCTGTPITYNITVNPTPAVSSVADQTYCSGASAPSTTLSGPIGGSTFTWTNSNTSIGLAASGSGNIPSFTATNVSSAPVTATITITPSADGCTGTPITYNITVNPTPAVSSVADQTYCSGASAPSTTLSGPVGGSTFTWTNSNTSIGLAASGSGNIPSFTAGNNTTAPITATITITPTANGCTGTPITYNITVNPTPTVSSVADQTYCSGTSAPSTTLSGPVDGSTFSWTNSNPTIGLAASGSGNIPSFTATNATATPAIATITITPSANGCTGTPITYNITVNPTPTVSSVTDQTYCSGASAPSITLSGPVSGTTFSWTNSNPAIGLAASGNENIPSFTATNASSAPVTATITITPSANGCTGTPITYNITVNPTPTVSSVADQTYCSGASAPSTTLSGPVSGTSFSWTYSNPAIGLAASGPGNIPSFTATNASSAPVTATIIITPSANGCTGTPITYNITVNPTPTILSVTDQTYCSGASAPSITLSGPVSGTSFSWTNSNPAIGLAASGSGNIPSFTAGNNTTAPITAIITITPTANGCTGTPSTYTITVNPLPSVSAVSNAVYCNTAAGAAISFASNVPGATFAWTSSANVGFGTSGTGGISAFTASNSTGAPIVATVSVVATANGCTGAATTFTITVNPIPAITATPATQTVCSGTAISTITFSNPNGVAGTTYAWTRDNTGALTGLTSGTGSSIAGTLTNTTNTVQGTTFTITASANGCTSTTTATVTVNPRPTITNQTATICSGGTFAVTPVHGGSNIIPAGTTYTWGVPTVTGGITGGAGGSGSSVTGTLINPGTVARTATYTVTPVSGTCTGNTFTVTVTVNPVPAIADQTPPPICSGTAFNVTPSGTPAGTTYTWSAPAVTGGITGGVAGSGSSITGTFTNTTGAVQTATYTVTPSANGCPGSPFAVTATINPATVVTTAPVRVTACAGGSATFSVAATGLNLTYQWQVRVNGNNYNNIAGATSATYTKTPVAESDENRYRVIITGTCGTANPTADLIVNPLPGCSITGTNAVCPGISTTFTASGGGTYSWTGPNGFAATTQTVSLSDSGTYTVTVTNSNGCQSSCTRTLTFNPTPAITVTPSSAAICSGTSTTLVASGASSFSWNPGTGLSSTIEDTVIASPRTTTTYTVTGYNSIGCYGSTTVTVTVTPEVVGGTLSPAVTNYCEGAGNGGTLTLSGYTGPIVRWEASTNGGASWSTINNTSNTLSYSNLTQTTLYRAFLEDGPCSDYSATAVVTITPLVPPTGATASPTEICLGDSTTLSATASGYPPGWNTVQAFNSANMDQNEGWSATVNGAPHNIEASADNEITTPWNLTNPHTFNGIWYDNPASDKFAIAAGVINTSMISAAFNTIGLSSATFSFMQAFNLGPGAVLTVEISTDSGLTWHTEPLMKYTGPLSLGNPNQGWVTTSIDLSNYLGLENLKIRWNYQGTAGSNWAIDNAGIVPPPLPLIYNWTLTDPPGVPSPYYLNSTTGATVKSSPTAPGTYTYTVSTVYGGCPGGSMSVPVLVKPLPVCNITGENAVCPGSTNIYSAPAIEGYTYNWTISGGATISGSATGQTVTVVANNTCGIYTLTLVTTLNGCSSSTPCTLVVNVVDNTAPVAPAPETLSFQCLADVPAAGTLTATDNCSGNITAIGVDVQVANGCGYTITRTWTFTDACNNTSSVSQIINVADNIPPVITCPPEQIFCAVNSNTYTIPPATASDNCSGTLNITYQITGATARSGTGNDASGVFNVGISTITWTVTDTCGNTSTCTTTVTINPRPSPIISHN